MNEQLYIWGLVAHTVILMVWVTFLSRKWNRKSNDQHDCINDSFELINENMLEGLDDMGRGINQLKKLVSGEGKKDRKESQEIKTRLTNTRKDLNQVQKAVVKKVTPKKKAGSK